MVEKSPKAAAAPASKRAKHAHKVIRYYRTPGVLPHIAHNILSKAQAALPHCHIKSLDTENCFNIEVDAARPLSAEDLSKLEWLLSETFEHDKTATSSFLASGSGAAAPAAAIATATATASTSPKGKGKGKGAASAAAAAAASTNGTASASASASVNGSSAANGTTTAAGAVVSWAVIEVGPRMSFESAFSSNAKSICAAAGLDQITRVELSRRFRVNCGVKESPADRAVFLALVHDRMTEMEYATPPQTFNTHGSPEPVTVVDIMGKGQAALEEINAKRGLGFDAWDLDFYLTLFRDKLKRNPTDVELFDMGQANSEHSRHWFFGGKMVIDGVEQPKRLFDLVKETLPKGKPTNSVIAFHDNSSSIKGFKDVAYLRPSGVGQPSAVHEVPLTLNPILTAETHNFPSGVAPFAGAETGTGGRLRDVMATGRGAYTMAGVSAYSVGNLRIPGYEQPWETGPSGGGESGWAYASNLATPLDIVVEASNGASDYGNKFGEPVVHGFCRSFGLRLPNGERSEYVKPIMFSAGVGQMDHEHTTKGQPEVGMWVVKIGGPAYRIGLGGGAASSRLGNAETADLDFNAVQRGDAEMENRVNRLMRACIDLGDKNPIISVHDQGAGGNGNVLKEIVDPAGASYDIRKLLIGDDTMSVLEIWGAEYQENNAALIKPEGVEILQAIAKRENCPISLLGRVTGDGRVTVHDSMDGSTPYDLPLAEVLGDLPQKVFTDAHDTPDKSAATLPLMLPFELDLMSALDRVLRLLHVGSKRFLTNKVDRSVSGLIAQQQCVGPLQTPLSNCAVLAQSFSGKTGIVTACGEQPIKGLVNSAAMARMTVAEAISNAMWAKVTKLSDFKASGNWMWASKLPGECAKMWDACVALRQACLDSGIGIDGGKDSLSMAAECGGELVKSPGTLVMTLYNTCPDISLTVTPDLKLPDGGSLLYIDFGHGKSRTGGTSLAQAFGQVGNESPDMEDFQPLVNAFDVTQTLLGKRQISAGHDRSDGGLITTILEMAFAGNVGVTVTIPALEGCSALETLFGEEAGLVLEVASSDKAAVIAAYKAKGVTCIEIGSVTAEKEVSVTVGEDELLFKVSMTQLRDVWEATSFQLERRQANVDCVVQEEASLATRKGPSYHLTYTPTPTKALSSPKPKVCVLRQEGSNGDREMCAAFHAAGLEAWDVNMNDLLAGTIGLERFQGLAFVGGFSYADVLDSAKGWAGAIKYHPTVLAQFEAFKDRKDTFSLGVCNGCQLMALMGWVPGAAAVGQGTKAKAASSSKVNEAKQPRFIHNESGRYESRWVTVQVQKSPAILLAGMEGSSMGVWVAHGEGKVYFPDKGVHDYVNKHKLTPLKFVDDSNKATEAYPFNPNGSVGGITALCSDDGRHLAMMPHPERCFTTWQCPYLPQDWRREHKAGFWLQMFQNARTWCLSHTETD